VCHTARSDKRDSMKDRAVMLMPVAGFISWCVILISSHLPWFLWFLRERSAIRTESTSIWGLPHYVLGLPYIPVDSPTSSLQVSNLMVVVNLFYLVLFFFGMWFWLRSAWRLREKINRQGLTVVVGAACLAGGIGLVIALKLVNNIAQQIMMHTAISSGSISPAELVAIHIEGPLMLVVGIVAQVVVVFIDRRMQHA